MEIPILEVITPKCAGEKVIKEIHKIFAKEFASRKTKVYTNRLKLGSINLEPIDSCVMNLLISLSWKKFVLQAMAPLSWELPDSNEQ